MQKKFILIILIMHLAGVVLAQGIDTGTDSTAIWISDSSSVTINSPFIFKNKPNSVFDIYWVTNSIKCGWKSTDTLLIGNGIEPCDTVHPFVIPVVGKLLRGCTSYHSGWDIKLDYGAPVVAGLSGKVRYTDYCSGYGKLVIIRHYSGMEMYYAHLSKILVKRDQWVEAGDTIGLGGATGRARGNHLHMEFRLCDRALDVADYYVQNDTTVNLYKVFETASQPVLAQGVAYHTVVRGDTLYDIARRYGTTVTNLCQLNNISSKSVLRIGQKIRVV